MLQGGEIIVILLLALVVLGPQRLPELARRLGAWAVELRTAARDITKGLEAEVAQVRDLAGEVTDPVKELRRDLKKSFETVDPKRYDWTGPKPVSGPTPEDAMADLERIERAMEEE
ncbi:MAG: twin-arginine translocase TatA/TatE family subunit [Actinobacteria bacterium]|nr:twin-arginine translocase TatA/TatE family subunit [Actinomycetota bacterium]MCI0543585.1 twin-arginine translocase TatA/TatE family subunit [Actinomycetota bacterium]MCI0677936.1 twin-arginine translocase TatA/TatE family subunit [Actinomycetota bacterium]